MMIYIITFIISLSLIYISYSKKIKPLTKSILIFVSLLIPCFLAANRALSIGTDTDGYILKLFNTALKTDSFSAFCNLSKLYFDIKDYGYLFITYISAHCFKNFKFLLFIIEFLVIVPIFKAIYKSSNNRNEALIGMSIFYLFMYNVSYNMARQSISISFLILGIVFLQNKKNINAFLSLLISIAFHNTSLISILIFIMFYLIHYLSNNKSKILTIIVYIASLIFVFLHKEIIYLLYNTGLYSHGLFYLQRFSNFDFSFTDTIFYATMLLIYCKNKEIIKDKNINYDYYKFLGIESLIVLQLGAFVQYMERVSFYFFYPFIILAIPKISLHKNILSKYTSILLIIMVFYWIYIFVILNSHNTIPYMFY